jgi:hypothetical protein
MLMAPSLIGVTVEHVGFPTIFLTLAGLLLAIVTLAPVVDTNREGARRPRPTNAPA